MTRVVVTGAAGFLGSHLVDALLDRGDEVTGVDNFDSFYPREVKERNLAAARGRAGFRLVEADIVGSGALEGLLDAETVVVHLAAKAGVRPSLADPEGYARANLDGTAAVLASARRAGVRRLVFGSSSSVYGNSTPVPFREDAAAIEPISPYAATKRAAELLLQSLAPLAGIRVAALRYFTVYGPRQRPDLAIHTFARLLLAGEPITLFGDGTQARDYTYVSDIVSGTISALEWTAEGAAGVDYFNLGGNRPVDLAEVVSALGLALGVSPVTRWAPLPPGDVERTAADLTKSGRVLGFHPAVSFDEGIRRFGIWCREVYGSQR